MRFRFILLFQLICTGLFSQTGWQQITSFGTNPGNLNMYIYVPVGISSNSPAVVALHGCTQNAIQCRDNTGWNMLADRYHFYVIYPEQPAANNSSNCFNWFLPSDQNRDGGEALSIKQMVDYMQSHYMVDAEKIFTTGLSAGAAMSAVMLACYPDVFKGGAIMSGGAYKSATDALTAGNAMYGLVNKTPTEWRDLVYGAFPGFNGVYPRVAIFHGLNDNVVYPANINELVEQWTAVHGLSQTATATISAFIGNPDIEQAVYKNTVGDTLVLTYKINYMGHAIAVDPGIGITQGGTTGTYAVDKNFYSSYWAAKFFKIITTTTSIEDIESNSKNDFVIFPNPTRKTIQILHKHAISCINVFDYTGRLILTSISPTLDVSSLVSGSYVVDVFSIQLGHSKKLLIIE